MSKVTKKELRQRCIDNETAIARLESILKENGIERQPQLKQLDQSVFDGADPKYITAATNEDGRAFLFPVPKSELEHALGCWFSDYRGDSPRVDGLFDASNWQNSLLERDIAKELKQLDQSVFKNMHERWRFAAIDAGGRAYRFNKEVSPYEESFCYDGDNYREFKFSLIGKGYDASNWQNSLIERDDIAEELLEVDLTSELTGSELCRAMLARGDKCVLIRMGERDDKQAKEIGRFAIATSIDESGRFNVMSDQQPISKVDFAVPINNQGESLTASDVGL